MTFSAGVRRLEAGSDQGLVLSQSVPFGSTVRAAPFEHEAEFRRCAINAEVDAARADLYRALYALYRELLHARPQADALRRRVIAEADRTPQHTDAGYARGRHSCLELLPALYRLLQRDTDINGCAA